MLLWTTLLFGQARYINTECKSQFDSISNRIIYSLVDSMPEFPGGNDSLKKFILNNLIWPNDGANFIGTVFVSFVVEIDGTLTNKKILRGIYEHADEESLRIIDIMPKWIVGKCKGESVPVKYVMPIRFRIE